MATVFLVVVFLVEDILGCCSKKKGVKGGKVAGRGKRTHPTERTSVREILEKCIREVKEREGKREGKSLQESLVWEVKRKKALEGKGRREGEAKTSLLLLLPPLSFRIDYLISQ